MELDLNYIENQLQKRWQFPYRWGQKQNDLWDNYTNFIYKTPDWEEVTKLMKLTAEVHDLDKNKLFQFAANRWYNFWSAMAVEQIFTDIDGVIPAINRRNRLVDFSIFGIDFDHKTSVFPKSYKQTLAYAQNHKRELIAWLYKNQSQQKRKHLKNRLFIIVYDDQGEHWKMKARLFKLQYLIQDYVRYFNPDNLERFEFEEGKLSLADIIWALK
ncbi:MAG TPA: hypothetical protein VK021_00605 [Flavobacteriaceae bacterium]|nr:hypothetical protein [Flavobacteriaceae bacterium]